MIPQQKKIRQMLAQRQASLLAHYYQKPEVQEIADILCDSLALGIAAARCDAKVIVFAGVHFMAQSAAILSPQKTVLLPRADAGCPLADMANADSVKKMRRREPDAVFVTYVNSTAAILQFARKSLAREIIVGIEEGILAELQKHNPGTTFILASPALFCVDMKKITLDDIIPKELEFSTACPGELQPAV